MIPLGSCVWISVRKPPAGSSRVGRSCEPLDHGGSPVCNPGTLLQSIERAVGACDREPSCTARTEQTPTTATAAPTASHLIDRNPTGIVHRPHRACCGGEESPAL